jgi:lysine 2,3-aminomutase
MIWKQQNPSPPFGVTPYFAALAGPEADDPIRRQFAPDPRETVPDPFALTDPLGENKYRITPRLIHQYPDRVLLKTTGQCAGYCRYCFRRAWIANPPGFIDTAELAAVLEYLRETPGIREILISGGDPLTSTDDRLERLFASLRESLPGVLLRLCTRSPITNPARLTGGCIALLGRWRPLRMAVHINHPRELSGLAGQRLAACADAGIPVHVQTVLLRGINDHALILAELFWGCLNLGLSPYYLFQLDLAPGTAHFRVPLKQGLAIYGELRRLVSGLALPKYAVDLPGGGGKIVLHEGSIAGEEERPQGRVCLLRGPDGKLWPYPSDA